MASLGILGIVALLAVVLIAVAVPALIVGWMVTTAMERQAKELRTALDACFAQQQASLQQEMQSLAAAAVATAPPSPAAPARAHRISEDKLMILGAVLACHFGKRVKIRSARVITLGSGSNVWSQQGRAQVQASHSGLY